MCKCWLLKMDFSYFYWLCFQGIMLVYDITSEKSFENIKNWIRNIEEVKIEIYIFCVLCVHLYDTFVKNYFSFDCNLKNCWTFQSLISACIIWCREDDPRKQMWHEWQETGVQRERRESEISHILQAFTIFHTNRDNNINNLQWII